MAKIGHTGTTPTNLFGKMSDYISFHGNNLSSAETPKLCPWISPRRRSRRRRQRRRRRCCFNFVTFKPKEKGFGFEESWKKSLRFDGGDGDAVFRALFWLGFDHYYSPYSYLGIIFQPRGPPEPLTQATEAFGMASLNTVNRLGDFWKFLVKKLLVEVAQIFGDCPENITFV